MMSKIYAVWKFIKRIIYPPGCIFCQRIIEINSKIGFCGRCSDGVTFTEDKVCCKRCGKPIVGYNDKQLCYFCLNINKRYFDRIVSVFTYKDLVRDSIIRFKANGYCEYVDTYTDCMMTKFYDEYSDIPFDFICGAPSNDKKNRKKHFDHVDLLCRALSKKINLKYKKNIFRYLRKTVKQSSLGYDDRQQNMKNNLLVSPKVNIAGSRVLLVDDVCTTRATIIECSRALKAAGASKVYALTVATVNNPK